MAVRNAGRQDAAHDLHRAHRPFRVEDAGLGYRLGEGPRIEIVDRLQGPPLRRPQGLYGADQGAVARQLRRDAFGAGAEMLGQQIVAHGGELVVAGRAKRAAERPSPGPALSLLDGLAGRRRGFQHQIAFGVQPHGAVVQVGRADAQDAVVHHHDLGVHGDAGTAAGH